MDPALEAFRKQYIGGQFVQLGKLSQAETRGIIADIKRIPETSYLEIISSDVRERMPGQDWYAPTALGVVTYDDFEQAEDGVGTGREVVGLDVVRLLPPGHPDSFDFSKLTPRKTIAEAFAEHRFEQALVGTMFRDGFMHVLWIEPLPAANRIAIADVSPRQFYCTLRVTAVEVYADDSWYLMLEMSFDSGTSCSRFFHGAGSTFWAAAADALNLSDDWQHSKPSEPLCSLR